jgi:hypothetical protein
MDEDEPENEVIPSEQLEPQPEGESVRTVFFRVLDQS